MLLLSLRGMGFRMSNKDIVTNEYSLLFGDCLERMKEIPDGSVDLTVTSPPYDNLRTYAGTLDWSFEIFKQVANELYRITKDGGVVVWVVGDATVKGSETGTSFKQALYFKDVGFNLHDTMIWEKSLDKLYADRTSCNKGKMNFRTLFTPCATLPATGRIRIKSLKPAIVS